MIDKVFWQNKKVFITGHTGFKGSWLSLWLASMGAEVKGYSLEPPTSPSLFEEASVADVLDSEIGDIRDLEKLTNSVVEFNPDVLFHMAAQPLVRLSYKIPIETYEVNVIGTAKVLEAAKQCKSLKAVISVTTDKCYENKEWVWGYRETDPMGGHDPYSSSKACAELVTSAYMRSFYKEMGIGLASVRAGNVIGGGDWADDRLMPDILRAFEKDKSVVIRNPKATRPWQHVLEPLSGYILLAEKLFDNPELYSEGWNFGPNQDDVKPVEWILNYVTDLWQGSSWTLEKDNNLHEAGYLKLDISKAKSRLDWSPIWSLGESLKKIISWHRVWLDKGDMNRECLKEIEEFMRDMAHAESR